MAREGHDWGSGERDRAARSEGCGVTTLAVSLSLSLLTDLHLINKVCKAEHGNPSRSICQLPARIGNHAASKCHWFPGAPGFSAQGGFATGA